MKIKVNPDEVKIRKKTPDWAKEKRMENKKRKKLLDNKSQLRYHKDTY